MLAWPVQGKTTLARALLAAPGSDVPLHDGSATSAEEFRRDPDALLSTVMWEDQQDMIRWVWQVCGVTHSVVSFMHVQAVSLWQSQGSWRSVSECITT